MKTLKNKIFFLIIILLNPLFLEGTHHLPAFPSVSGDAVEYEGNFKLFLKSEELTLFTELQGALKGDIQDYPLLSLTVGPYYRLLRNLKSGLFYQYQSGARHDDDWIKDENGQWIWKDTQERGESILIFDLTPRVLLDFLPGENWILEVKNRVHYNFFNYHQSLSIRPGLTYFWLKGMNPFLSLFLQYQFYIPLNFSRDIYAAYLYLGGLYHCSKTFQFGPYIAFKRITWGASKDFKTYTNADDYQLDYKPVVLGLSGNIRFDL